MLSTIFEGGAFWTLIIMVVAVATGFWFGRLSAKNEYQSEISELLINNKVLDQKLSDQQVHFEAQLKLLEEAKASLGQEFENLANRIFDDKQNKFSQQSKEQLENSLSPLRRDIGEFRQQVSNAYEKENADRNKLVGQILLQLNFSLDFIPIFIKCFIYIWYK